MRVLRVFKIEIHANDERIQERFIIIRNISYKEYLKSLRDKD